MIDLFMVSEGCDCAGRKPEYSVVFCFFKEKNLGVSVIKAANQHNIWSKGHHWNFGGQLLVVQTSIH